jgi:tetratricopeptide (TPR) repeat protein
MAERVAVLAKLASSDDPRERGWANSGWMLALAEAGDLHGAVAKGRAAVKEEPANALFHANLGAQLSGLGHQEAALEEWKTAVRLDRRSNPQMNPRFARRNHHQNVSAVALLTGDYAAAARELMSGVALTTGDERLYFDNAAGLVAEAHDMAEAARLIREAPPRAVGDLYPTAAPAWLAFVRGDWADALPLWTEYDKALAEGAGELQASRTINTWPYLAELRARTGDVAGAAALLSATPADCYDCAVARAVVAGLKGDGTQADRGFAEAARLGPSLPYGLYRWGESLLARGDADAAIAKLRLAQEKGPRYPDPVELWGEALLAKGDAKGAAGKFAQAAALAPKWGRLHLKWGEALARLGKADEARARWRAAAGMGMSATERADLDRWLSKAL